METFAHEDSFPTERDDDLGAKPRSLDLESSPIGSHLDTETKH
jgi:hypothetical protein